MGQQWRNVDLQMESRVVALGVNVQSLEQSKITLTTVFGTISQMFHLLVHIWKSIQRRYLGFGKLTFIGMQ
jgi:hypothetical protein